MDSPIQQSTKLKVQKGLVYQFNVLEIFSLNK